MNRVHRIAFLQYGLVLMLLGVSPMAAIASDGWDGTITQYGRMREAIGSRQHHGRVALREIVERPHFYGVAALERLSGEATIYDGQVTVTRVESDGKLVSTNLSNADLQATLLVGAYVPAWTEYHVPRHVSPDELDAFIAEVAAKAGIDTSQPFVFTVEGELLDLRWHVIHGACPMHARLHKLELPKEQRPFESEQERTHGTLVGVYAADAVGNLTHPATSCHTHVLLQDADQPQRITGHVEQVGIAQGATLRLPK